MWKSWSVWIYTYCHDDILSFSMTSTRYMSWASQIKFTYSQHIFSRSILYYPCIPFSVFQVAPSTRFSIKILHAFFFSSVMYIASHSLFSLTTLVMLNEPYKLLSSSIHNTHILHSPLTSFLGSFLDWITTISWVFFLIYLWTSILF